MSGDRGNLAMWHPFADMSTMAERQLVIERGEGVYVFDSDGRRYLDASAGLWYANVGHGRRELAEVAARQMETLAVYPTFDLLANPPALALAERLRELAPFDGDGAAFFTSGGSDSVDTAAKIARRYWIERGEPDRELIISREGAYHGVNSFGTSLSGIALNAERWGPLVDEVAQVGRNDIDGLRRLFDENRGRVAAVIGEPVQGAGGVHPPPEGYWDAVQELCAEHGALLIADEVITGFGRLGSWFGSERLGIKPDLITCAKGLSSGYLPVGAVLAAPRILDALWAPEAGAFRHGYTYSGHPTACAVALANLEIIEREGLLERVAALEPELQRALGALVDHPLVEEVRGIGLLCGVQLSAEARADDPGLVGRIVDAARERGVIVRNLLGTSLQASPPFVITAEQIAELASALREALDAEAAGRP